MKTPSGSGAGSPGAARMPVRPRAVGAHSDRSLGAYLGRLWRGEVPLRHVLVNDMLIAGTVLNVLAFGLSLVLLGLELPRVIAGLVFFAPLPYNAFVFVGVWRSAERTPSAWSMTARMIATVWLVAMFFV